MKTFGTFVLAATLAVAQAWPTSLSTDISTYTTGSSFGNMGISNFENSYSTKCEIEHNVPVSGYVQGQTYTLTVKTDYTGGLGLKIKAGTTKANSGGSGDPKLASKDMPWTATGDATMDVYGLCGAGGSIDKMWVAQKVTLSKAAGGSPTPSPASGESAGALTSPSFLLSFFLSIFSFASSLN